MPDNVTQFQFTAEDLASQVALKMQGNFTEALRSIAEENRKLSTTVVDGAGKIREHGAEVNKLTQFYREQRSEHRLNSFFFREGRDVVGAGALALTAFSGAAAGASESMKRMNSALQEGFVAFQGLNFLLSSFEIDAAPIIALVAGLGAAWFAFSNDAKDAAKAQKELIAEFAKNDLRGATETEKTETLNNLLRDQNNIKQAILFLDTHPAGAQDNSQETGWQAVKRTYQATLELIGGTKQLSQAQVDDRAKLVEHQTLLQGMIEETRKKEKGLGEEYKDRLKQQSEAEDTWQKHFIENEDARIKRQLESIKVLFPDYFKQLEEQAKMETAINELLKAGNWEQVQGMASQNLHLMLLRDEKKMHEEIAKTVSVKDPTAEFQRTFRAHQTEYDKFFLKLDQDFGETGITGKNAAEAVKKAFDQTATSIVDAFFGAQLSISNIFENILKDFLKMEAQMLEKKLLFSVLGIAAGGIGSVGGSAIDSGIGGAGSEVPSSLFGANRIGSGGNSSADFAGLTSSRPTVNHEHNVTVTIISPLPAFKDYVNSPDVQKHLANAIRNGITNAKVN